MPWYFQAPAIVCCLAALVPISYLLVRAFEADAGKLSALLLRPRNANLLLNTVLLTVGVTAASTALALPLAFLTTCAQLPARRLVTLLSILPLAIPGYLMAYAMLAAYEAVSNLSGADISRPSGYSGALIALSLYNFPYMFLNLRVALQRRDQALEETARSLGQRPRRILFTIILPQLRPALLSGMLLISLHVIADFGVVSLMRFETFSYALFLQYTTAFDRTYAAWIALMLLALAALLLIVEMLFLRGLYLERTGIGPQKLNSRYSLGKWMLPSIVFVIAVTGASVVLPISSILFWVSRCDLGNHFADLLAALVDSVSASLPAAVLATALATPVVYAVCRYPSRRASFIERLAYLGFATPALAFALGLIFFALRCDKFLAFMNLTEGTFVYQSLGLLIVAYAVHFLAEALGPIRSALYQAGPQMEEAARGLGRNPFSTFWRVTFPMMRNGLVVSLVLVFLAAMKELPITFLLAPLDFQTLATLLWSYSTEWMFADAAPYALTILLLSLSLVALLLRDGRN